jgi:hypothetical protein
VANFGDESIRDERINRAVSYGEDNKKKKKRKKETPKTPRPHTRSVFFF